MKPILLFVILALTSFLYSLTPSFPEDPAISPDGSRVCFSWNGDLFSVPFEGGTAIRLTSAQGKERSPMYSPDGNWIAFQSSKNGYSAISIMSSSGGEARELPVINVNFHSWFPDSKELLISDLIYSKAYQTLNIEDGSLHELAGISGIFSDLSKDGNKIIYCSDGDPFRKRYQGTLNGDLWEIDLKTQSYKQLTKTDFTERYPVYSKVHSNTIYYCAPYGDQFQIYRGRTDDTTQSERITDLLDFSARDLSIANTKDRIVFEYFNKLYCWDEQSAIATAIPIEIKEDIFSSSVKYQRYSSQADKCNISPDGNWFLFSKNCDLFAAQISEGEVKRLTFDQPSITDYMILPDNQSFLIAIQDKNGFQIQKRDIAEPQKQEKVHWNPDFVIEEIGVDMDSLIYISYSVRNQPKRRIYYDNSFHKQIYSIDNERVECGLFSPDMRCFFYLNQEKDANCCLKLRNLKNGTTSTLSSYADSYPMGLTWTTDKKALLVNLNNAILSYELNPRGNYAPDPKDWHKTKAYRVKIENNETDKFVLNTENFEGRGKTLVMGSDYIVLIGVEDNTIRYFLENERKFELHTISDIGKKDSMINELDFQWIKYNESHKRFYFMKDNSVYYCDQNAGNISQIIFEYDHDYDQDNLNSRVFTQLWCIYKNEFYDPEMHGLNWEISYSKYHPFLKEAQTQDHFVGIINEMVGDLNTSHTEFSPKSESSFLNKTIALIGCEFDFTKTLKQGIVIKKAFKNGELATIYEVKSGDVLLSLDGKNIHSNTDPSTFLINKEGKKVDFTLMHDGKIITGAVKGLNGSEFIQLSYLDWVAENREEVDKISNSNIGYMHIRGMNEESLKMFKKELVDIRQTKKALIIDVRNNGGGYTHYSILDELLKETSLYQFSPKQNAGFHPEPPNVYLMPKVLLINQNCASATEAFAHIFRARDMGKIIGVGTQGAVIGTGITSLMDGSQMRLPDQGVYTSPNVLSDMEGVGAKPDILSIISPEEEIANKDTQLILAVEELLKQLQQAKDRE